MWTQIITLFVPKLGFYANRFHSVNKNINEMLQNSLTCANIKLKAPLLKDNKLKVSCIFLKKILKKKKKKTPQNWSIDKPANSQS